MGMSRHGVARLVEAVVEWGGLAGRGSVWLIEAVMESIAMARTGTAGPV